VPLLRSEIGLNQTVWGVKNNFGRISWELYFYRHLQPEKVGINHLSTILKPFMVSDHIAIDEKLPYLMFSFDIDERNEIINSHVYFGKYFGNSFHAWSYLVSNYHLEFENHYEFFTPDDYKFLPEKVLLSPFVSSKTDISQILVPEFMDCRSICVASKRNENGIYFSGLNIKQYLFFLEKFSYQKNIIEFVKNERSNLKYILFDIGFNYKFNDNNLEISKSGFYGTF
jgi:hypothetical protein